ncbi:hypothetical protein N6N71_25115, partial [Escherichia albertii]|uniref:hypothetical protein n=1 Tax=Escherichia albertii TaxID=208962 RepID=UPI0021D45593
FSDPGPVFHTIVSIKNDGHYFCRAGGNRPDGLNEPVTYKHSMNRVHHLSLEGRYQNSLIFKPITIPTEL